MGSSRLRRWGGCLLWTLCIFLSGCPNRMVVVAGEDGQLKEVPVAEAARMAFEEGKKAADAGQAKEATAKLEKFQKDYPDSDRADAAAMILGDLAFKAGRYEKAIESYRSIVSDHPQSPHYIQAAVQLGLSLVKAGRTPEAVPTLQSVFERLDTNQRKAEVAGMLAEAYQAAQAPVESLRWYAQLYALTAVPGAREAIKNQLLDLIDQQMSFVQVREALEILKQANARGFPADVLEFKLAKIFYHMLDFPRARESLEAFAASYPDHERGKEAGALLKKIIDRNRVQPDTIGVLLPLTGEYREYGRQALEGIQLGAGIFDEAKDKGSAGPVLVIRDTAGDPDRAVRELEDLVLNEHVIGVIGPMVAKEAYAASVKAQELEVPIITLSARKDITQVGAYAFRNFLTFAAQARALVAYAMDKLGVTRFGILYPNDMYGVEFANAFWDEIDRRKGEVRAAERYEPDEKNFAEPIKKMVGRYYIGSRWDFAAERAKIYKEIKSPLGRKRALEKLVKKLKPIIDFQVLFVPDYVDKVVLIAPAIAFEDIILQTDSRWQIERMKKSLGRNDIDMVYLMGGNGWNSPKVIEWAERYVQGAIFTDGFFTQSGRAATKLFVGKFRASFDHEPSIIEAQA
jgi:outer membrane PBP1 activator LpoA protein